MDYVELQVSSNFSFLEGASHPHELIKTAVDLQYKGIALTDRNSLAGIIRGFIASKDLPIQYIVGAKVDIFNEEHFNLKSNSLPFSFLIYPTDRSSYGKLCRFLSNGKLRAPKGECFNTLKDFLEYQNNFVTIILPPFFELGNNFNSLSQESRTSFETICETVLANSTDKAKLSIAIVRDYNNTNRKLCTTVCEIALKLGIQLVASNNIHYHCPERKQLQDVLSCIRNGCTIKDAGFLLSQNRERYLKSPKEMAYLFRDSPSAIKRTIEIAEQVSGFSLSQLRYEYPDEICPKGQNPLSYLTILTWQGANERFPSGIPEKVKNNISAELALIHELNYEKYFLTCHDIIRFAKERGILCQGRGAAANSAVCYCLGITAVDPSQIDLLFARFVSKERSEPPDIDIDFEHERREEVIQYIYSKYSRERAGITAEVITYRDRSAIRDVGKVFGFSLEEVDRLAKSVHRWINYTLSDEKIHELGFRKEDPAFQNTLRLTQELLGFPRHLSQHVGGFIISEKPLCETVPILNGAMADRTFIEWDKDDIESLGILKIDVLGLGMLSAISKAFEFVNRRRLLNNENRLHLYSVPHGDKAVYDMICAADTIGLFQIESRAQMSMLPRLKPRCFYDLVIEIAIVRPGPIQGNMVHPFLKRRNGIEEPYYPDQKVRDILGKTLGVPIFQEQAMRLAIVLANFSPGEAEMLRRAMASWKRNKHIMEGFRYRIINGMAANGYSREYAENYMEQIKGFSEYGFPESHSASFALIAYASAWLKKYYPAEFAAALINSQPMGFYAPSQIISDAQRHDVDVLPIDINKSYWDCSIEDSKLRLGFRLIKGISRNEIEELLMHREKVGRFHSITALWKTLHVHSRKVRKTTLALIAKADGFDSLGLNTREALWEIHSLIKQPLSLDLLITPVQNIAPLPTMTTQEEMFQDYSMTGLSLRSHPVKFIRANLNKMNVITAEKLRLFQKSLTNKIVAVAGLAIFKQRPPTAKGIVFITIEDETGIINLIIKPDIFEKYQDLVLNSSAVLAKGKVEAIENVIYINAFELANIEHSVLCQTLTH